MDDESIKTTEEETPSAPTAEKETTEGESVAPSKEEETPKTFSEEELEWSKLKGSTQDRIRQLIQERNEERNKRIQTEGVRQPAPEIPPAPLPNTGYANQQPTNEQMTAEQIQAVQSLRKYGIVTQEDLQAVRDRLILDSEYQRLESVYAGKDERPKFDRVEVEDHMRKTGIYNPEKAYKDLYEEELFDWKLKRTQKEEKGKEPYTTKPKASSTGKGEPITAESVREKLSSPGGREWWEKNRNKILPLMGEL